MGTPETEPIEESRLIMSEGKQQFLLDIGNNILRFGLLRAPLPEQSNIPKANNGRNKTDGNALNANDKTSNKSFSSNQNSLNKSFEEAQWLGMVGGPMFQLRKKSSQGQPATITFDKASQGEKQ